MTKKIFIAKLPFTFTKEQLTAKLAVFGSVSDVAIPLDRETNRPRGIAFATFATDAEAAHAIQELNGAMIEGRDISVVEAIEREFRPQRTEGPYNSGGRQNYNSGSRR